MHLFTRSVAFAWLATGLLTAATAGAATINFDSQPNGKKVTTQYSAQGVTISADNRTPGHPDYAITFDTTLTGTRDKDLEDPWTGGGNIKSLNFHKVLIIA